MKVFGHYLFEDDPELLAYQAEKRRTRRESEARSCENDGKLPSVALPRVEFGDLKIGGIPATEKQLDRYHLQTHHRWSQEGRCHLFNGKKYCYHTGQEIITDKTA